VINTGTYQSRVISSDACSSDSSQTREDIIVDVLQLLSDQYGLYPLGLTMSYAAESCDQVFEANPASPSSNYWVYDENRNPVQSFCQF
jgi:hypothetical protein